MHVQYIYKLIYCYVVSSYLGFHNHKCCYTVILDSHKYLPENMWPPHKQHLVQSLQFQLCIEPHPSLCQQLCWFESPRSFFSPQCYIRRAEIPLYHVRHLKFVIQTFINHILWMVNEKLWKNANHNCYDLQVTPNKGTLIVEFKYRQNELNYKAR